MNQGKYYLAKRAEHNYSAKLDECIQEACKYCIEQATNSQTDIHPLMVLGKIQSGKTRAFTGLMALAFDNDFDMIFILTKNSKALLAQTYKRMRKEFEVFINSNEINIFDIMRAVQGLTRYELKKKIIIVAKKEKNNLDKMSRFITEYMINQHKNCLIIDDEADTTSIGFSKVQGTDDEFDLRTIAAKINDIRGNLEGCTFVQVTATPYALYLQPDFNDEDIKPVKPQKTVSIPSGDEYIGSEYYFLDSKKDNHPARFIYGEVSDDELKLAIMKKDDRRMFKVEEIITREDRLTMFKAGIMNFIVGGCVLRRMNPNTHYSYVIHTATQKDNHSRLESITQEFLSKIIERDASTTPIIENMIKIAYEDILRSVNAFGHEMPTLHEIRQDFFESINEEYVSVSIINSDRDIGTYLCEETGELTLRTPLSIFVGGQVLDRGVTIPRMIGFFYGRNPKTMQQDTVLQHSRMFGYRKKEWLSVTRFYTSRRIYENMVKITEIDVALREDIENNRFTDGIYFIQRRDDAKGKIVPCSPAKIKVSDVVYLKPEQRILPVGFSPIPKSYAAKHLNKIQKSLSAIIDINKTEAQLVDVACVEDVIAEIYELIKQDDEAGRFIPFETFMTSLKYLTRDTNKVHLIVRTNRNVSKYREKGRYLDTPDTAQDEATIARMCAIDHPALMLIHQTGKAEGWEEREFWWPVLRVQRNAPKTIYALDEAVGKIKRKRLKYSKKG
jgi:hypothetical protein